MLTAMAVTHLEQASICAAALVTMVVFSGGCLDTSELIILTLLSRDLSRKACIVSRCVFGTNALTSTQEDVW